MKEIKLTQGKIALVDDDDFEKLNQWEWHAKTFYKSKKWYAARSQKGKTILMHRIILNPTSGMDIDHQDNNGLNNQKSNIRICTRSQNRENTGKRIDNKTGFKGVCWYQKYKKYSSSISHNRKRIFLGYFNTPLEAAKIYNEYAKKIHGDFAHKTINIGAKDE